MKTHVALVSVFFTAMFICAGAKVTVEAGDFDRHDTVVSFKFGPLVNHFLKAGSSEYPLQSDDEGNAWFVLDHLQRGERKTFEMKFAAQMQVTTHIVCGDPRPRNMDPLGGNVTNCQGPLSIMLPTGINEGHGLKLKKVFTYHTEKTEFPPTRSDLKPIFHRSAYIHPVLTPSGVEVTGDYPPNHMHHHGIWMAWTHTEFEGREPDFWNMGDGKGTVEFVGLDRTWNGPVHAGFVARHRYIDLTAPTPKAALNETWNVRVFNVGSSSKTPYFLFDIDLKDECATKAPVKLPEYRYGGICVRGNWAWNGKGKSFILTSEGDTDAAKGDKNQVHARWVHLGGMVNGKFAGIAAFDHPTNFRFPEPVRLNPAEPYFNFAPQQAGDMEITPEKPFTAKYRFVVADGKPDAKELERLWNDYAHPPKVTVSDQ